MPSSRSGEDERLPLTSMTGFLLQRAGAVLLARAERVLEARGVRARHAYVLAALRDTPDLSQHDLAQLIGCDAGILGALIDEMEASGQVARHRSPRDKRRYVVNITLAGNELLDVLLGDVCELEREFLGALSSADAAQLRSSLERLLAGQWPEAVACASEH